jgi:hypothetical protein
VAWTQLAAANFGSGPIPEIRPFPYNDPQGGRLVLGWKANSESARNAAKKLSGAYKNQKLKDQDSFFEVLDSLTGAPIGGVLVQFAGGPSSFDSAFSCGF